MSENEEIKGQGVYAPEVLGFVKTANEYCAWIESLEEKSASELIKSSLAMLSKLYHAFVQVEEFEAMMDGENERFVTEKDWSTVYQKVMNLLGRHHSYNRIAESGEFDRSDIVTHTISEDLADLYQDMKDFIMQFRQGVEEMMNDAIWELQNSFEQHWAKKLLHALHALNHLYVQHVDPENDEEELGEGESGEGPGYDNSFFTRLQDEQESDEL